MNDTISNLNERQIATLIQLRQTPNIGILTIFKATATDNQVSLITIKRDVAQLLSQNLISVDGKARATTYKLTSCGLLNTPVNALEFTKQDPDNRRAFTKYNHELFSNIDFQLFSANEFKMLDHGTQTYSKRLNTITPTIANKELERFIIEFSWKSSVIEGNTYSLLDTEKLIKDQLQTHTKTPAEATMILNHKKTFNFVQKNFPKNGQINVAFITNVHELLTDGLSVTKGIRNSLVGITSSAYRPLDNKYQIKEALQNLCTAVNQQKDVRAQALLIILGVSYIQPFEDGNKRTARMIGNAILVHNSLPPLSYRSVPVDEYRAAMIVFYELNTLVPFKEIFIEQYLFSADNYLVK